MSVLIKGMEKPEHCGYCRFRYDGICHALQKTQYSMNECPLVVIDDVGLNDTISRQAAIDAVHKNYDTILDFKSDGRTVADSFEAIINTLPSVQTEQKRGRWVYGEDEYGIDGYRCDRCGFFVPWDYDHKNINYINDYKFCPFCGEALKVKEDPDEADQY